MPEKLEDRIKALSPLAKQLLLTKVKETLSAKRVENTNNQRKKIVAYIKPNNNFSLDILKENLKSKLPDYMVPSQFVTVQTMPLLPNGKIDRHQLQKTEIKTDTKKTVTSANTLEQKLIKIWEETLGFAPINKNDNFFEIGGDSILSIQIIAKAKKQGIDLKANDLFEHQTIEELALFAKAPENTSNTAQKLIKIWEETLGFAPINKNDNFFEIGGDSILSIQIIAKAKKEGIILKANDLFEHQTIAELALFSKKESQEKIAAIVSGTVPLSPIQHWFFEDHKNAPNYWNQGVQLNNLPKNTEEQIAKVCNHLITQHDALRARFIFTNNTWKQEINTPEQICALEYVDFSEIAADNHSSEIEKHTQRIQNAFNLSKGSLFKCIYFKNTNGKDFCRLIAHHLVVDAVSWKIIIDDFITLLEEVSLGNSFVNESKTSSFKEWTNYLNTYTNNINDKELAFWQAQITPVAALPVDNVINTIEEKDIIQIAVNFKEDITASLISGNKTLNTKTEELLITAFVDAISNWSNNEKITIGFERHGRETENSNLDVSKTVGWFTSYFPLQFIHQSLNSIDNKIIAVKEKMRSIPNGGIGYGGLRYLKKSLGKIKNPEIVFNYLGTQIKDNSTITTTTLTENLRDLKSERYYKLEVNAVIIDNCLEVSFSFSNKIHHTTTIENLVASFKENLARISEYCNNTKENRYTPSDFTETNISQDDLDSLLNALQ